MVWSAYRHEDMYVNTYHSAVWVLGLQLVRGGPDARSTAVGTGV